MVDDADAGCWIEIDGANFAGVGDQRDFFRLRSPVCGVARLAFDAQQFSSYGRACRTADFDARAAESAEKFGDARAFAEREAQCSEAASDGSFGVVIDSGDAAAVEVEDGERFQHVVELRGGEIDVDVLAAAHAAEMFEIADAVFVEDDSAHRQFSGRRGFRCVRMCFAGGITCGGRTRRGRLFR